MLTFLRERDCTALIELFDRDDGDEIEADISCKLLCIQLAESGRARCPPHNHVEKILVQIKGATA
ncbi:MAG: hypothetical protein ACYTX0_04765 [Nostoc sp.]